MEEQITNIIQSHNSFDDIDERETAKDITKHVMEFIAWTRHNCYADPIESGWEIINDNDDSLNLTDEGLYRYWLSNVKEK
jgi:hypothetical protein